MRFYLDYERVSHHKSMLSDYARTSSFKRAISKIVRKESVVADVGTGTGVLAFFAKKAGAKRVYAVERTDIIDIAERLAETNAIDGIIFLKKGAARTVLPEKCDVIVSECLGYFALQENMVGDVLSFRKKNLKKNGRVIPRSVDLFLALASSPGAYEQVVFWGKKPYGLDFSFLREIAVNTAYHLPLSGAEMASKGVFVKRIDLERENNVSLDASLLLKASRSCVVHGLCGYFSAFLAPGIVLSNSPLSGKTHWKCEFFPFRQPVSVKKGQVLKVRISADMHKAFVDWNWSVESKAGKQEHSTLNGIRLKEL